MTKEQTAQQLELAAQILRTGHPFEFGSGTTWNRAFDSTPFDCLKGGYQVRPVLATPPYPAQLHNPDNLTAEQVGVGYRLALPGESAASPHDFWDGDTWKKAELLGPAIFAWCCRSCRLPLSVPWPEPEKTDPYAELKAAHAAGKVIQYRSTKEAARGDWSRAMDMRIKEGIDWDYPIECFRIKPETAFQLPPCAPGMRWHREDGWKADDLPSGYRPLVFEEQPQKGDEHKRAEKHWEPQIEKALKVLPTHDQVPQRTTRPLVFNHAGKTWTWHRPGDPMPCDRDRDVCCLVTKGCHRETNPTKGRYMAWSVTDEKLHFWGVIIGWRYAEPQTKTVPLGPEDVPPGSAVTTGKIEGAWAYVVAVDQESVLIPSRITGKLKRVTYEELRESRKVNRSIPLTGKWSPDAWEPCSKTIPADDNLAEPKSR